MNEMKRLYNNIAISDFPKYHIFDHLKFKTLIRGKDGYIPGAKDRVDVLISEPYPVSKNGFMELIALCEKYGLDFFVTGSNHCPFDTFKIILYKDMENNERKPYLMNMSSLSKPMKDTQLPTQLIYPPVKQKQKVSFNNNIETYSSQKHRPRHPYNPSVEMFVEGD